MELTNGTALRKLQGTARLLELATAAGPNGVVVVDATLPDYPIIFANRGFEKMSGYLAKEVLGRNCRFMRDLTEEQPDLNALRAAVSEGREWSGVLRNYRKDGSPFWNELHISPIRDAHGQLTNFVGVLADITDRKKTEAELRHSEARLAEAQRIAHIGNWGYDFDTAEAYWSAELYRVFGFKPDSFVPNYRSFFKSVHPDDLGIVRSRIRRVLQDGEGGSVDYRVVRPNGDVRTVHTRYGLLRDEGGRAIGLVGTIQDVTERAEAEKRMREAEERYRTLVETIPAITYTQEPSEDHSFASLYLSPQVEVTLGYSPGEFSSDPGLWVSRLHPEDRDRVLAEDARTEKTGEPFQIEYRMIRKDGRVVWIRDEAVLVRDGGGRPKFWQGVMMDITERKVLEDRLSHQAMHDSLTGLPNRDLFSDRLVGALSRAGRRENEVAVLFLDLDNFKYVNDSLGHGAGDRLLGGVARRLSKVIRPEDTLARLGGDEFVVLLEDLGARAEAFRIATRIQEALRTPITVDDREFFLTTSIGIAFGGNAENQPEDLLREADAAMYRAKQAGKDRHALFSPELQERSFRRLGLEGDLRRALKAPEKELRVFYQPKALIETGGIVGTEALVRWEHPERGLVLPAEFIPLAEETGMIVPLGRWVLVEACRQTKDWQLKHPTDSPLFVNVNLSACQFRDPGLARDVRDALAQTNLDPESLILEITESTLMEDAASTLETLRWLKDLGVKLAIDDFGTGYSSLAYLKRFPVDAIKIDRSIISGLERDSGNAAIVSATITLAHALGLEAVAEGVEEEGELAELHRLGCDLGQGYYFWKPASAAKISALLAAELRRPPSRIHHR